MIARWTMHSHAVAGASSCGGSPAGDDATSSELRANRASLAGSMPLSCDSRTPGATHTRVSHFRRTAPANRARTGHGGSTAPMPSHAGEAVNGA